MKRFINSLSIIFTAAVLSLALVGCQSTAPVDSVPEIEVPVPAPAAEAPAPAPEVETEEAETPVAVTEESTPVVTKEAGSLSFYGYTLTYEAVPGKAEITYPSFITEDEVDAFFAYAAQNHGDLLSGVYYDVTGDGTMTVTFPENVTVADASAVVNLLSADLSAFVADYLGVEKEEVVRTVENQVVSIPAKETGSLSYYGYTLSYEAVPGKAVVSYPSFITEDEIDAFFSYAAAKHGDLLSGVYYDVTGEGQMTITFPEDVTVEDAGAVVNILSADLSAFISDYLEPEEEPVAAEIPSQEPMPAGKEYPYGVTGIVKADGDDTFNLYVVHTNDVHARIVEGEDGSMGYAKLSTLLKMGRSVTDNILVLDAGDVLHGTNLANVFEGESVGILLTMLGYDAVSPGNHDFNYGAAQLEELAALSEAIGGPKVLAANIIDGNGNFVFQPYQVYEFNGFDVVVIGLSTPDTKTKSHPKNTEGLTFWDDSYLQYAQSAIDLAHEIGDYVIVLGHMGLGEDGTVGMTSEDICTYIDGIDLFVDGHSHTVLENGLEVNDSLIVSTGQYLNNVGVVEIQVVDGQAEGETAILIPASAVIDPSTSQLAKSLGITKVADDPEVTAYVDKLNAELDERFSEVVANVPVFLDGERANVRTKQTNLSRLICEALTAETGSDFTIINGGGIRASIEAGDVTLGDINNVLPFTNTIAVCEMTGEQVLEALEFGYSLIPEQNGGFAQSDLKVVYSRFAEPGSRIRRVLLPDGTPLDTSATYLVTTNDFMAAGGDGFTMFGDVVQEGGLLNEAFADYLAQVYPAE